LFAGKNGSTFEEQNMPPTLLRRSLRNSAFLSKSSAIEVDKSGGGNGSEQVNEENEESGRSANLDEEVINPVHNISIVLIVSTYFEKV
jgi:hypothetical protein